MKIIQSFLFFISSFFILVSPTWAVYDPLSKPNNIFGVHILFPSEISEARNLINSKNGDWGYVTIPIQSKDRDLEKWQKFMDDAKKLHIIPIIRIATKNDYFNSSVWEKPTYEEVLDFANFLNSLNWPTQNRYVVAFNEVNRADEWGGNVSPSEYAVILDYAVDTFKAKSPDFFIISAGLDNAAPNQSPNYMDQYSFMRLMNQSVPGIFKKLDGIASHAYPNPGFSQPPQVVSTKSIHSFIFEANLVQNLAERTLPIFITETGWSQEEISEEKIADYYKKAFESVWSNGRVIAVTPFILRGHPGPFSKFSLLSENGEKNLKYKTLEDLPKISGQPVLNSTLNEHSILTDKTPVRDFPAEIKNQKEKIQASFKATKVVFKWLLKI